MLSSALQYDAQLPSGTQTILRGRGIDDGSVREMLDELSAHLDDAVAAGRTPQDVVGNDVKEFAASWARARAPFARRLLRTAAMVCFVIGWMILATCLLRWTTERVVSVNDVAFWTVVERSRSPGSCGAAAWGSVGPWRSPLPSACPQCCSPNGWATTGNCSSCHCGRPRRCSFPGFRTPFIGIGGYESAAATQSDSAVTAIRIAAGAVPALAEKKFREIVAEIAQRQAEPGPNESRAPRV
jgi:hypothetical protein